MKKVILLSSAVLLVANVILGLILSFYGGFNLLFSSIVIVATGALLLITDTIQLKDGYKASLTTFFVIAGIFEFVLSLIAPNRIDNWWLILFIAIIAFEVIMLIITNTISRKIK